MNGSFIWSQYGLLLVLTMKLFFNSCPCQVWLFVHTRMASTLVTFILSTFCGNVVFFWSVTVVLATFLYLFLHRNSIFGWASSLKAPGGFPRLPTRFQMAPKIYNNCSLLIKCSTRGASVLDFPLLVPKKTSRLCKHFQHFEEMGERGSRSGGIWEASTQCLHVPVALTLDTGRLG